MSLISHFPLNGSLEDLCNNFEMKINSTVLWDETNALFEKCANLTTSTSYMYIDDNRLKDVIKNNCSEFSISLWIRNSNVGKSDGMFMSCGSGFTHKNIHWGIRNGRIYLGHYSDDFPSTAVIHDNKWYHVVVTMDKNKRQNLYVNGEYHSGRVYNGFKPDYLANGKIVFGNWGTNTGRYIDYIQNLKIYDTPISAKQVKEDFLLLTTHYDFKDNEIFRENLIESIYTANGTNAPTLTEIDIENPFGCKITRAEFPINAATGWHGSSALTDSYSFENNEGYLFCTYIKYDLDLNEIAIYVSGSAGMNYLNHVSEYDIDGWMCFMSTANSTTYSGTNRLCVFNNGVKDYVKIAYIGPSFIFRDVHALENINHYRSGFINDLSGHMNNTEIPDSISNKVSHESKGYIFNSSPKGLELSSKYLNKELQKWTISVDVKIYELDDTGNNTLIGGLNNGIRFLYNKMIMYINGGSNDRYVYSSVMGADDLNKWFNITARYDQESDTLDVFINGVLNNHIDKTTEGYVPYGIADILYIKSVTCKAGLGEFKLYSKFLSDDEILNISNDITSIDKYSKLNASQVCENHNMLHYINSDLKQGIKHRDVTGYNQANCVVTHEGKYMRIVRPPDILHANGNTTYGGIRIKLPFDPFKVNKRYKFRFKVRGRHAGNDVIVYTTPLPGWGTMGSPVLNESGQSALTTIYWTHMNDALTNMDNDNFKQFECYVDVTQSNYLHYSLTQSDAVIGEPTFTYEYIFINLSYSDTGTGSDIFIHDFELYEDKPVSIAKEVIANNYIEVCRKDDYVAMDTSSISLLCETHLTNHIGPFGYNETLAKIKNVRDGSMNGGFNTRSIEVDHTAQYRFSVWVSRELAEGGRVYLGTNQNSTIKTLDNAVTTNPYFMTFVEDEILMNDRWLLKVAYVNGSGSTVTSNNAISGIYNQQGVKLYDGIDYKMTNTASSLYLRVYLYYSHYMGEEVYWARPRIDKCDGTEPSLEDLLNDRVSHTEPNGTVSDLAHITKDGEIIINELIGGL